MGAILFAIPVAYGQMGLAWGQGTAEFSADSDATLKVAGRAFAIWGVIGVFAAEQSRNGTLVFTALAAALALLVGAVVIVPAERRRVERRG